MTHDHYFKDVSHLDSIDIYRVIELFDVRHSALQHALKKILAAGKRGAKNDVKDVREAMDSLTRWQQMRLEDEAQPVAGPALDWEVLEVQLAKAMLADAARHA